MDKRKDSSLAADDAAQLAALGYTSEFKREMSMWANFSLGFLYLSPVVGVYTIFGYALATGGPPSIYALLIAGVGQLLVACVFGEVVAQFPVAGGVYPWARRLWGRKWAWMTGWVYMWALMITIASVAYGAGPYIAWLLGFTASSGSTVTAALILIALATVINFMGTKVLAKVAIFGLACELTGCIAVGLWLLIANRHQSITVIFHHYAAGSSGGYFAAFAASCLLGLWVYYGFEACGDVAEEVPNPGRTIPKAMRRTVYIGGIASTFICLSFIMATPNISDVISGKNVDPVRGILISAFTSAGAKVVLCIVLISFLSCCMSLQAAASRLLYSYGRDRMIFASKFLSHFWEARHIPPYALIVAAALPAAVCVGSLASANALTKIISFAANGIYIAFAMVVLAALRARMKGWQPSGLFTLKGWAYPINVCALAYQIVAMVDMSWPRTPNVSWVDNWIVLLSAGVVLGIGLVFMALAKPYAGSDAPYSDATTIHQQVAARRAAATAAATGADGLS